MKPLYHLTAHWDDQSRITFKWGYPGFESAQYVYIYSVGPDGQPDEEYHVFYDVSLPQNPQDNLSYCLTCQTSLVSLRLLRFVAFCTDNRIQPTPEEISRLACDPQYVVQVLTGRAKLTWSAKARKFGQLKVVSFSITSDALIPPGILGYVIPEVGLCFPIPMEISQGTICTPPILIRAEQDPSIVPFDPAFAANFTICKKKPVFFL